MPVTSIHMACFSASGTPARNSSTFVRASSVIATGDSAGGGAIGSSCGLMAEPTITPIARILLILPTATYRAPDFMAAARKLGAEVVVASEHRQAMSGEIGDRALVLPRRQPELAVDAIAALHERRPLDAVVAVDDTGLAVAALASERLALGPS